MDDRRLVLEAAEARARALADRDPRALREILHEEFRWTSHTGETFGRDDYVARNTSGAVAWRSQHLDTAEVVVVGDAAVLYAEVVDVIDTAVGDQTFRMPMTQLWVRQHDRWRCIAGHAGPRRT